MKSKEEIQKIKKEYPPGTVIKLINMDDPNPVPSGTIGTVDSVDDAGQIHCEEFYLAIVPDKDEFEVIGRKRFSFWVMHDLKEGVKDNFKNDCYNIDEAIGLLNSYENEVKELKESDLIFFQAVWDILMKYQDLFNREMADEVLEDLGIELPRWFD